MVDVSSVNVVGWNANRIPGGRAAEVASALQDSFGGSIICLQEVSSWSSEVAVDGFVVLHTCGNPAAILIPRSIAFQLNMQWCGPQHTVAILGSLCIVSAYLPDCTKSLDVYSDIVRSLRESLDNARIHGARYFVVSSDTQVELPSEQAGLTGPHALGGRYKGLNDLERQMIVMQLAADYGIRAANTWLQGEHPSCITRLALGRRQGSGSQIDHVFVSDSLGTAAKVPRKRLLNSDHFPVSVSIQVSPLGMQKRSGKSSYKGWQPRDAASSDAFAVHLPMKYC